MNYAKDKKKLLIINTIMQIICKKFEVSVRTKTHLIVSTKRNLQKSNYKILKVKILNTNYLFRKVLEIF